MARAKRAIDKNIRLQPLASPQPHLQTPATSNLKLSPYRDASPQMYDMSGAKPKEKNDSGFLNSILAGQQSPFSGVKRKQESKAMMTIERASRTSR